MQELTTEQAKGLQVALHAEDASGPFSFPQASSLTKLKKAVSQAVAAGSWVGGPTLSSTLARPRTSLGGQPTVVTRGADATAPWRTWF